MLVCSVLMEELVWIIQMKEDNTVTNTAKARRIGWLKGYILFGKKIIL